MTLDPTDERHRLQIRRKELLDREDLTRQSRETVELDQTRVGRLSRMDALQAQAMSLATDRRRLVEIQRIEAALDRLECGEFGYCTVCGDEIGTSRLELDPATPICIACASRA